eukprot:GHVN01041361.1.p1 GENE.GHVN01041361.1~~GHVN01041361.1.p1  ORF type:complete len:245 (+),score=23.74 GHVN01041361.1:301-1035(+)
MVLLARSNSGLLVGLALASFSTAEAGTFVSRQPAPWKPVRERASLKYSISQTEPPPESTSGLEDKEHDEEEAMDPSDLTIMISILTAGGALCLMLLAGLACFHIAQRKAEQKKRLQKRLSTFTIATSSTNQDPDDRSIDSLTVITSTIVDKRKQARREGSDEVKQHQVSDNRLSQLRKKLLNLPPPPNAPRRSSCPTQSPPAPIREFMRGSTADCTLEQPNIIDYSSLIWKYKGEAFEIDPSPV